MGRTMKNKKQRDEMFQKGFLWCSGCKMFLPIRKFTTGQTHYEKYSYRCNDCKNSYDRIRGHSEKSKAIWRNSYRHKKQYYSELFGRKCSRCGFSDGFWALEFHHVSPSSKKWTPSKIIHNGKEKEVTQELDKCVLLCSNCHKTLNKTWIGYFGKTKLGYKVIGEDKIIIRGDNE